MFSDDKYNFAFKTPNKAESILYDLQFSASWYHGPSFLPPYLLMKITPKNKNFRFEITVDMESVKFMDAYTIVQLTRSSETRFPILIQQSKPSKKKSADWHSIIGKWRNGPIILEISKDQIKANGDGIGESIDYPNGTIAPLKPGEMSLKPTSGGYRDILL